jgi:hypothetical protein
VKTVYLNVNTLSWDSGGGVASGSEQRRNNLDMIDLMCYGNWRPHLRIQRASRELTPIISNDRGLHVRSCWTAICLSS